MSIEPTAPNGVEDSFSSSPPSDPLSPALDPLSFPDVQGQDKQVQQMQSHQYTAKTIFVGGFSSKVNEKDLLQFFGQMGKVLEVKVIVDRSNKKSKGYGFVTFEDENVAEGLRQRQRIPFQDNKQINICSAYRKEQGGSGPGGNAGGGARSPSSHASHPSHSHPPHPSSFSLSPTSPNHPHSHSHSQSQHQSYQSGSYQGSSRYPDRPPPSDRRGPKRPFPGGPGQGMGGGMYVPSPSPHGGRGGHSGHSHNGSGHGGHTGNGGHSQGQGGQGQGQGQGGSRQMVPYDDRSPPFFDYFSPPPPGFPYLPFVPPGYMPYPYMYQQPDMFPPPPEGRMPFVPMYYEYVPGYGPPDLAGQFQGMSVETGEEEEDYEDDGQIPSKALLPPQYPPSYPPPPLHQGHAQSHPQGNQGHQGHQGHSQGPNGHYPPSNAPIPSGQPQAYYPYYPPQGPYPYPYSTQGQGQGHNQGQGQGQGRSGRSHHNNHHNNNHPQNHQNPHGPPSGAEEEGESTEDDQIHRSQSSSTSSPSSPSPSLPANTV